MSAGSISSSSFRPIAQGTCPHEGGPHLTIPSVVNVRSGSGSRCDAQGASVLRAPLPHSPRQLESACRQRELDRGAAPHQFIPSLFTGG